MMKEKDDKECCTFIIADEWESGRLEEVIGRGVERTCIQDCIIFNKEQSHCEPAEPVILFEP